MKDNFQEYEANFSAIMESKKMSEHHKEDLLEGLLKDTEYIFQETVKNTNCSKKKKQILEFVSNVEDEVNMINKKNGEPNWIRPGLLSSIFSF